MDDNFKTPPPIALRTLNSLFGKPVKVLPTLNFKRNTQYINVTFENQIISTTGESTKSNTDWSSLVKETGFEELGKKLIEFEIKFGVSTIHMFENYVNGKGSDELEEWVDTYILYLGCSQIRRFSCP